MTPTIERPTLRYYGGGWNRARWTLGHFPAQIVYCEPCFGSGEVLMRKPASKLWNAFGLRRQRKRRGM